MQTRRLGATELEVTRLSLGSWRTFERIGRDDGLALMRAAREHGINLLDDARYDDETGHAPLPTGYSEVLFGELFRASGWDRETTVVSNKLWWEFWPEQDAAAELDGSLGRMGFDHIDLIYANPPPEDLPVAEMVAAVAELVAAGKARAWRSSTGMRPRRSRPRVPRPRRGYPSPAPPSCPTAWPRVSGSRASRCGPPWRPRGPG